MRFLQTILLTFLLIPSALPCDEFGNSGFLPENDMEISVDAKIRNDMTEERFNEIIDKVVDVYTPIVKKKRGKLKMKRLWTNNTVNASAQRFFRTWVVNMYGGLARHPDITDDAFLMVVCHEMGHHLGGAPKSSSNPLLRWASNEGQSDYWGAMKCFRRSLKDEDSIAVVATLGNVDPLAQASCSAAFNDENEVALCVRSSMAGKSLSKLLGRGRATIFDTPDPTIVKKTNNAHPNGQCRLDTYFQGSLCEKDIFDEVDNKDPNLGVCSRKDGYENGLRPLCWYKPQS